MWLYIPHNNLEKCFKYLEMCLVTLAKENKEVYICGDFNLDLLKIDTYFVAMACYPPTATDGSD